jgi:hypothetical protein
MYTPSKERHHYLHITSDGKELHRPKNVQGLVIVAQDNKPILEIGEVSCIETINIFLSTVGECSGIVQGISEEAGKWEILANRCDR